MGSVTTLPHATPQGSPVFVQGELRPLKGIPRQIVPGEGGGSVGKLMNIEDRLQTDKFEGSWVQGEPVRSVRDLVWIQAKT